MAYRMRQTIASLRRFVLAELRNMAAEEEDGALLLINGDFGIDYVRGGLKVVLEYERKVVWETTLPFGQTDIEHGDIEKMGEAISNAMRHNLSLVAEMHNARLSVHFPKRIKKVEMTYDAQMATKIVHVTFHNGHVAEAPEAETRTDLFLARCMMLYDLPPI